MAAITITDAGKNLLRDSMKGATNPLIKYVAFGSSSTAPATSDTQLGAEFYRKAITSYANGASVGEILVNLYLAPSDLAGTTIAEIGFFGGSSANSNPNTGVLLAHGLYSHTHANTESIQFQLDFQIS